jgi:hypothetical protein
MECSQAKLTGLSRIEIVVILVALAFLIPVPLTMFRVIGRKNAIFECSDNLAAMGKSMLAYANEYDGVLPVAGGKDTRWGARMRSWSAGSRSEAFGLDPNETGGEATIGASLYLLVRYTGITPESFLCAADKGVSQFKPAIYAVRGKRLADLWDFGPDPAKHCSYAYQMVYNSDKLTTRFESHEAGFAIAADRNPWMDSPFAKAKDFSRFRPDLTAFGGTNDQARYGNTFRHQGDGQNVWYLDDHVEFARRPFCGLEDDNIYTVSGRGPDRADPQGTPPRLGSQPANRKDSLLVNDLPAARE